METMVSSRASWMWPLAVMVAAIALVTSVFVASFARASGQTAEEPTYYACLFAGSLTPVGTAPPANCGRGELIRWSAPRVPEPVEDPVEEGVELPFSVYWA